MDQIKIGKFIASQRKEHGLTQSQLAEKLGITDKAVSKWETGKSLPDLSLFTPLCSLLDITLNELLLGEVIPDECLKEKSNQVLFDVISGLLGNDKGYIPCLVNNEIVLQLKNVKKIYDEADAKTVAINGISFEVAKGSFVGIMGASGSGKSTLLNMIATIDKPSSGTVKIDGQDVSGLTEEKLADFRRQHLGFIFQEYNLLDTLTIYENIALALTIKEAPKKEIQATVKKLAAALNITDILQKFPYEVSGGQRQRCACARAIVANPSLILADEPTGALDSHSAKQLLETLVMFRQDYHATILMVTHDAFSASYCDRIFFLKDGEIKTYLDRGEKNKQDFFADILDVMAKIAEDSSYVS
ncbi:ATP-binding cassette domain-containing protein [Bifidobacterium sp. 6T3]|uniref:ATP-binding cassette domain-containing protein n=1 Tax=Bifidobacterium phasiani TaxID=2834431 RepID=A0ABS6WA75_9BIFI|nr:ATP-binding cassette domain-containing protein [Bifidobacterium phasiani]MBW3083403.1 ATP-binding cassette domain-containing protein [Bifidobacterium phasiani]